MSNESHQVTLRQIAEQCGVSVMTVSRALRGGERISAKTCAKVKRVARELGYKPNPYVSAYTSYVRTQGRTGNSINVAWLTFGDRGSWHRYPWNRPLFEAAEKRCSEVGMAISEVWCSEPGMTNRRLRQVLENRGTKGLLVPGGGDHDQIAVLSEHFPTVGIGTQILPTTISRVTANHYENLASALEQCTLRGYRRIGLVCDRGHLRESCGLILTGFLGLQPNLADGRDIPPLVSDPGTAREPLLRHWLKRHRPDCLLVTNRETLAMVRGFGYRVPDDIALVNLFWSEDDELWSGMDLQQGEIASAAVDSLTGLILRGDCNRSKPLQMLLVSGRWVEGTTTRPAPTDAIGYPAPGRWTAGSRWVRPHLEPGS